jgi:hypothetical protein
VFKQRKAHGRIGLKRESFLRQVVSSCNFLCLSGSKQVRTAPFGRMQHLLSHVSFKSIVILLLVLSCVDRAHAQATTFVELGNLSLFPQRVAGSRGDIVQTLRNRYQLESAVLTTREWVQDGRGLDFAVIIGLGLEGFQFDERDPLQVERFSVLARERLLPLEMLPVKRIAALPDTNDLDSGAGAQTARFHRFLRLMRGVLPDKQIVDLSSETARVNGNMVVGMNNANFSDAGTVSTIKSRAAHQLQEVERVIDLIQKNQPALLFVCVHDLQEGKDKLSSWNVNDAVRQAFWPIIPTPGVLGVFGAPQVAADWSAFGTPRVWRHAGAARPEFRKAWLAPRLTTSGDDAAGLQFVSVTLDGKITVKPMTLPSTMANQSRPELGNKLAEGDAHLAVDDFDEAIAAYSEALKSKDAGIAAHIRIERKVKERTSC